VCDGFSILGIDLSSASVYGIFILENRHLGRRPLDDLPCVHHRDLIGPPGHDAEVVGHEDHGHEPRLLLSLQQVQDLRLHGHVEGGGGLVGDEEPGTAGQGHGDAHPLAHAAGELVRVLVEALRRLGDADRLEERERRLLASPSTGRGGSGWTR
jgi:hypothetical protein